MRVFTTIEPYTLQFLKPAGTSRGVYLDHAVWFLKLQSEAFPGRTGVGECAPLPDLSCDAGVDYPEKLQTLCHLIENGDWSLSQPPTEALEPYLWDKPSMRFGLETAWRQLISTDNILWNSAFTRGESSLTINGLIWMSSTEDMLGQLQSKLDAGFSCIKLKIGALAFEEELNLLKWIRKRFSPEKLTLRVDANGAFTPEEAPEKLKRLSELGLHSIEQPIKAGQRNALARLIAASPLPVALDEELIGVHTLPEKSLLLDVLKPHFLVLKPSLHGGIAGCTEWIRLAAERSIEWWITSALESNVGLNAIAQWTATLNVRLHQGLGTGQLYANNFKTPLSLEGENLWYRD